jgi:hypothetical protein
LRKLGIDPEELVRLETDSAKQKLLNTTRNTNQDVGPGASNESELETVLPEDVRAEREESTGVFVSGEGKSRYLENSLWTSLKGGFRDQKDILESSSSSEDDSENDNHNDDDDGRFNSASPPSSLSLDGGNLLFGTPSRPTPSLRPFHPDPSRMFKLWQTYLDNINPLIKVFHTPTIQQLISHSSGDLEDIPKNVEALLFAIYSISVESLSESECAAMMGESKNVVGQRFRAAAQHALINAGFLKTSDFMVLQALVLLISSLQNFDARVIWILTGVATRIGQRIGLHRDPATLNLPPFETEMRRRLWWQIRMQDGFAEKLAGTGGLVADNSVKRPSNVNDSDLFPGMKHAVKEHTGATEMMFFLIRIHLGEFLTKSIADANMGSRFDGVWSKLSGNAASTEAKDQAIDELEALYERKYTRFCDPDVPWHYMCTYLVKAITAMLRFIAHNPEHHGNPNSNPTSVSPSERTLLFHLATTITTYQTLIYTTPQLQNYLWHTNHHFQWKAFIYLLSELRFRTEPSDEVKSAWEQVRLVYEGHPWFTKEKGRRVELLVAVDGLALKAWEEWVGRNGVPGQGEPGFIAGLKRRREARRGISAIKNNDNNANANAAAAPGTLRRPIVPNESIPSPLHPELNFAAAATLLPHQQLEPQRLQKIQDPPQLQPHPDPTQAFQWDPSTFNFNFNTDMNTDAKIDIDIDALNWTTWDHLVADFEMGNETTTSTEHMHGMDQGTSTSGIE